MTSDTMTEPERAVEAGEWLAIGSIAARVAVLTSVAFLPVLACGFINGDDDWNFRDNVAFRGLDWEQIRWAWTTKLVGVYQPVAWMLLEPNTRASGSPLGLSRGEPADARGQRGGAVLLDERASGPMSARDRWCDPRRIIGARGRAVRGASAQAEVVAWASCQPYLPCVLFSMLAVLAYLRRMTRVDRRATPRDGWRVGRPDRGRAPVQGPRSPSRRS